MRSHARAAFAVLLGALFTFATSSSLATREQPILVFAAASLKNALDEISKLWTEKYGTPVNISYAASNALARQIEEGAPVDLFISADIEWMDYLETKTLVKPRTRLNLLGNSLALIAAQDLNIDQFVIGPGFPLAGLLGDSRLAMANVASVPAGKYGKAALETLGVWGSVSNKLAETENVRAALAFVARGETLLGIVYKTDAMAAPNVKVVGIFPADSHPPIVYPVAITTDSKNPKAQEFLDYLSGPQAKPIFEKNGFNVLAARSSN